MKKTITACIVVCAASTSYAFADTPNKISSSKAVSYLNDNSPYYAGKKATKIDPRNGALISDEMYREISHEKTVLGAYTPNSFTYVEVAPGVHTLNAGGIINVHVVETDNGLVIYDTGDDLHEGSLFYQAIRKQTNKPIKAIIYSHEHYIGGAKHFVDEEAKRGNTDIKIIGHYNHNMSVNASAAGVALHKEASSALLPRAMNQFYSFVDSKGEHAKGLTHHIDLTQKKGPVDVDTPINQNGQEIIIDGRKFIFYVDGVATDSANNVTVHVPDQDIVMNNAIWGFFPNIYSIRGGAYRNPEVWMEAIDLVETLAPKILLNTHGKTVVGEKESRELLHAYKDGLTAVLNQTLLSMVKGETRAIAAHNVKLPAAIIDNPYLRQNYGEISTMVPQIYSAVLGSFNGEVADAIPMHPAAEADMYIRLAGGQEKVLAFAKSELAAGNFHNALKMGNHLVNYDNAHQPSINFKVDAMHAMAQATMSHNLRSWYLTQARVLKGEIALPKSAPASPAAVAANVTDYIDNYRIRINHEKAGNTSAKIGFEFTNGEKMALDIRNGVAYSNKSIKGADVVINMEPVQFTKLYNNLSTISLMSEAGEAKITHGNSDEAAKLMDMFDIIYDWKGDEGLQFLVKLESEMNK